MRQSQPIEIDGDRYKVTTLAATKSRKLFFRLSKALAPAIAGASGSRAMDQVLREAIADLNEDLFELLCDTFALNTQIESGDVWLGLIADHKGFDKHFSGRILTLSKWLYACLKYEYADFFEGLPGLMETLNGPPEKPKASEPQST